MVKIVLLLSHGQASVEQGFVVDKNLITETKTKSLVSQRTVLDHVRHAGGAANVQVDKDFLKFAVVLGFVITIALTQKKRRESLHAQKRKLAEEEINSLKVKRNHIHTSIRCLIKSADNLAMQA